MQTINSRDATPEVLDDEEVDSLTIGRRIRQLRSERGLTLDDLEAIYPAAAAKAREDVPFRDRARKATAALQNGEAVAGRVDAARGY